MILLLVLVSGATPLAQQPAATSRVGEIVLLSTRPPDEASPLLREGITGSDPRVRTASARVVAALSLRQLLPPLWKALAQEQEPTAGAEQLRTIVLLQPSAPVDLLESHAARLGHATMVTFLEWLAVRDPKRLAAALALTKTPPDGRNSALDPAIIRAAESEARLEVLRAWSGIAPIDSWRAVLSATLRSESDLESAGVVLSETLASSRPHIREESAWFLVRAISMGQSPPAPLFTDLRRPEVIGDWESLARELLYRRAHPTATRVDASTFLAGQPSLYRLQGVSAELLSSPEIAELNRRDERLLKPLKGPPAPVNRTARTVQVWIDGLLQELLTAASCQVRDDPAAAAVALVTLRADGRPKRIELNAAKVPERCLPVFHALVATSISEARHPVQEDQQQWQLLPFNRTYVQCANERQTQPAPVFPGFAREAIRPPRKTKDVRPVYPEQMIRARVEGAVVMEAILSAEGCTRDLQVIQSAGAPQLDIAGMVAVSQWGFEPTRINGTPVPVVMTTTVNFSLR